MTVFLIVLFGVLSGSLLSVLVGLVGRNRKIGFGWTFLISLVFTPVVGLIIALISDPLDAGEQKRVGCVGTVLAVLGLLFLLLFILALAGVVMSV